MVRSRVVVMVFVGALAGAVGCGGDEGDGGGSSAFAAEADAICREAELAINETLIAAGAPADVEANQDLIKEQIPILEQRLQDLQQVEPSEDSAQAYEEFLSLGEQALELRREMGDADYESFEDPAFVQDDQEGRELGKSAQAAAADAGLTACAAELPEEDQQDVTEVVEKSFTSTERSEFEEICNEFATETYISQIGGMKECLAPVRPGEATSTVEVGEITGVEGVYASSSFTPSDGPNEGKTFNVELLYEDGAYKLDYLYEAPPKESETGE